MWRIAEQGSKQGIYFVVSVILARLIIPDQFGLVAMLTVFTAVAGVFGSLTIGLLLNAYATSRRCADLLLPTSITSSTNISTSLSSSLTLQSGL